MPAKPNYFSPYSFTPLLDTFRFHRKCSKKQKYLYKSCMCQSAKNYCIKVSLLVPLTWPTRRQSGYNCTSRSLSLRCRQIPLFEFKPIVYFRREEQQPAIKSSSQIIRKFHRTDKTFGRWIIFNSKWIHKQLRQQFFIVKTSFYSQVKLALTTTSE